jgi:HSP20 family protein
MFINPNMFTGLMRDMNDIRHEVDRLFGKMGSSPTTVGNGVPSLSLWEDEAHFYAELDVPNVAPELIDVIVKDGNLLHVQGVRKTPEPEKAVWLRQERFTGIFSRDITLPKQIDTERVSATIENGILKITLPKSEAAKPRKIEIKAV